MPYKDPEAKRAHARRYREQNRDRIATKKREWHRKRYRDDPAYRENVKQAARRSRPAHVARAQQAVLRAITRGELVRPDTCEECGRSGLAIEAAHEDYTRPLLVRWLCRRCHRQWDARAPKAGSTSREG